MIARPHTLRRNRRSLGRGQFPAATAVTCVVSSTGTTNVTLTFNLPVVVAGTINNTVATRTLVSQTQTAPNIVTQVWNGTVATLAYALPANARNVRSTLGGPVVGISGTFP